MRKTTLFLAATLLNLALLAQGNSNGHGKGKEKDKSPASQKEEKLKPTTGSTGSYLDKRIWEGVADAGSSCMQPSKNQPAKVRSNFQRDFPYAVNVYWTKCRGDWTASFTNGLFRSTAVYHANGDRRDTRTWTVRESLPRKILDVILQRFPGVSIDGGIKIQVPNMVKDIFRIKSILDGKPQYVYFDVNGAQVTYNY